MRRLLVFVALAGLAADSEAQTPQQLEAALQSNPQDRAARSALLDYYFLNSTVNPTVVIPARRRHILWLIENTPGDAVAGTPAATIDAAGHHLADPQGFKLASDAWRAQAADPDVSAAALANAAYFFKLSDKTLAISLLERALVLEPANKELSARLGQEYAMAIMGVTMVNKNGYPLGADPAQIGSPVAKLAYEALSVTTNANVLAIAGYTLSFQGAILLGRGKLALDTGPLAESVLRRAVSLAPGDARIASFLEEHRAIQRQVKAAR